MVLHTAHPALTLVTPLQDYCRTFFKRYHLNYFQFLRIYQDGSTAYLSTMLGYAEFSIHHAFKKNRPFVYSYVNKNLVDPSTYFFLWEEHLPRVPVALARNEFNICNGVTLVERNHIYYDMWGFGTPATNTNALFFYINHLDLLHRFINAFKEEQKLLIKTLETEPLVFPKQQHDVNVKEMLLKSSDSAVRIRIPVFFNNIESYVTQQEMYCIKKLSLGLTNKKIAQSLNISPRTVEQYFERVKLRVGCFSKLDLIQLLIA